jgi:hypothetical protein
MRIGFPEEPSFQDDALVALHSGPVKVYACMARTGTVETDLLVAADGYRPTSLLMAESTSASIATTLAVRTAQRGVSILRSLRSAFLGPLIVRFRTDSAVTQWPESQAAGARLGLAPDDKAVIFLTMAFPLRRISQVSFAPHRSPIWKRSR